MPPRPDRPASTHPPNSSPLDYVKYAVGIVAALLFIPALLQGLLAFVQTFVQTLVSIVLTLNLLVLSAVAGVVGVWVWQRRAVAGGAEPVTIEPVTIQPEVSRARTGVPNLEGESPQPIALTPQAIGKEQNASPTTIEAITKITSQPASQPASKSAVQSDQSESPLGMELATEPTTESTALGESATLGFSALVQSLPETAIVTSLKVSPESSPEPSPELSSTPSKLDDAPSPEHSCPEPLIQAQLARRLGVSSSTIGVRKLKVDFGEWSAQKDPAGLTWRYCETERQFVVGSD